MGKAEELYEFAIACMCKAVLKLDVLSGPELCQEALREEDGDIGKAMEWLLDLEDDEPPQPFERLETAKERGYDEDLKPAFVLDKQTAERVAKSYYKKVLSPQGPNVEVEKPLRSCCNTPNTRVWSMLFGSLVAEEPRWFRFEFAADITEQPKHLLEATEVDWKITDCSESGVSLRDCQRKSLSKRTVAALAKEWYEDLEDSAYGQRYEMVRQPDSENFYKTIYAECAISAVLEKAKCWPGDKIGLALEEYGVTDAMFLLNLMEKRDAQRTLVVKGADGDDHLTTALKEQCGINAGGGFYETEASAGQFSMEES